MKINREGLELIKSFEGCRFEAYDDLQPKLKITDASQVKGTLTIGYGHISGVYVGQTITQAEADNLLKSDLTRFEKSVSDTVKIPLNENQFSALVSFAYNCGVGNLKKLVANRNASQIADAILLYNKSKGQVLKGLVRRREAERNLFLKGSEAVVVTDNPYPVPTRNLGMNSRGDDVKWVQYQLNKKLDVPLKVDGIFGNQTFMRVAEFQALSSIKKDGIVGKDTRSKLLE